MTIKRLAGKTKIMYFLNATSTAFSADSFVTFDGSGAITPATSSSTKILGVYRGAAITSASAAYTTAAWQPVEVPVEKYVEWECTCTGGATNKVGVSVDLTDASTVAVGSSTHHVVTVSKYISSTKVGVFINAPWDAVAGA